MHVNRTILYYAYGTLGVLVFNDINGKFNSVVLSM
jgi:hypothetical protein